jgi:hypothetical protein
LVVDATARGDTNASNAAAKIIVNHFTVSSLHQRVSFQNQFSGATI